MRYSTPNNWAKYFKETEGIQISGNVIRRRLKKAEVIGITGRNKIGAVFINAFYSESDVRETCSDFLMTIEEIREKAKSALAKHNIHDRQSLIQFGARKFMQTDFPPFRKGTALARLILGETVDITVNHLNRIADNLGFPALSEQETKHQYIQALATHGIHDRKSLIQFGPNKFRQADFPTFGKGAAFVGAILGETVVFPSLDYLHRMADALGFPTLPEDAKKQQYIQALEAHDICDRQSLIQFGARKFVQTDFPPFRKGAAFARLILGETVNGLTINHLNRIADNLGLPQLSEKRKQQCVQALLTNGIQDRVSLINFGTREFKKTDFQPFGKGDVFAGVVIGRTVKGVMVSHLNLIADTLGFPAFSEDAKKQQYIQVLRAHGIHDSQTLIHFGTKQFGKADFIPFGKGSAFAGAILGETVYSIKVDYLNRIADVLFGK